MVRLMDTVLVNDAGARGLVGVGYEARQYPLAAIR